VCREILELGKQRITPLKLIKLAYISQGFHLGYYGKPIFDDEVEAWPYGPVIRSIYFAVNHFKRHEITKTLFEHVNDDLSLEAQRVIDAVIKTYDKYDALELSALTHRKGSPWDITVREKGINKIIPKSLIKSHYEGIIHASS
jgi:uncharacterized phage-associated protein